MRNFWFFNDPVTWIDEPVQTGFDEGGVQTPGWFNIVIWFATFDAALAAATEFRAAGYLVQVLDEIDEEGDSTYVTISRPAETATYDELFDAAKDLAERLGAVANDGWIADGRPRGLVGL